MAIIYRTSGPWGSGISSDLTPNQVDFNFWQLVQDVAAKAVQGVGISNIVVNGDQMTVVLTDHTLLGPYTLPTAKFTFRGAWAPSTAYSINDIITHAGSTYLVLWNHTSAATFDPNANDGMGHNYYGLLLSSPAQTIPTGGAAGTFLRKVTSADYDDAWQTAILDDLADVTITSPVSGNVITRSGSLWVNAPPSPGALANLTDVALTTLTAKEVLTWNGTKWANGPPAGTLVSLSDVTISSPIVGQPLVYNGSSWSNQSVADLPAFNIGAVSGTTTVDMRTNELIRLQLSGNLTINSFTWPTASSGQFVRRVVEVRDTGSFILTWPSAMKWAGGNVPVLTLGGTDVYAIYTYDGGATVYGSIVGQAYA